MLAKPYFFIKINFSFIIFAIFRAILATILDFWRLFKGFYYFEFFTWLKIRALVIIVNESPCVKMHLVIFYKYIKHTMPLILSVQSSILSKKAKWGFIASLNEITSLAKLAKLFSIYIFKFTWNRRRLFVKCFHVAICNLQNSIISNSPIEHN